MALALKDCLIDKEQFLVVHQARDAARCGDGNRNNAAQDDGNRVCGDGFEWLVGMTRSVSPMPMAHH